MTKLILHYYAHETERKIYDPFGESIGRTPESCRIVICNLKKELIPYSSPPAGYMPPANIADRYAVLMARIRAEQAAAKAEREAAKAAAGNGPVNGVQKRGPNKGPKAGPKTGAPKSEKLIVLHRWALDERLVKLAEAEEKALALAALALAAPAAAAADDDDDDDDYAAAARARAEAAETLLSLVGEEAVDGTPAVEPPTAASGPSTPEFGDPGLVREGLFRAYPEASIDYLVVE